MQPSIMREMRGKDEFDWLLEIQNTTMSLTWLCSTGTTINGFVMCIASFYKSYCGQQQLLTLWIWNILWMSSVLIVVSVK